MFQTVFAAGADLSRLRYINAPSGTGPRQNEDKTLVSVDADIVVVRETLYSCDHVPGNVQEQHFPELPRSLTRIAKESDSSGLKQHNTHHVPEVFESGD